MVEPAILESERTLAELALVAELMELTAAAEATSATRARVATLNKEESILVESMKSQESTTLDLRVPTTRHLYYSSIKVSASYGRFPRPYQAARTIHGRRKLHELNMVLTKSGEKV